MAHLQVSASSNVDLAAAPYRYLKRYSRDSGLALRVAQAAGLFGEGRAKLSRSTPSGSWRLLAAGGIELEDACVSRLLCRGVLEYLDVRGRERSG